MSKTIPHNANKPTQFRRVLKSTFALALLGSLLLWLAQPPALLGWLGWIAPVPWLLVVRQERTFTRGIYLQIWLAGVVYWLAALYWVCFPHPLTPIGLGFLAAYLGCYLPAFAWLARVATKRMRWPLWIAAPIAWTGLEFIQAHLFSGFQIATLSHTQAFYPSVIQIASFWGAYGVSFVLMLVAAAICICLPKRENRSQTVWQSKRWMMPTFIACGTLAIVYAIGSGTLERSQGEESSSFTVALIQGNTLAVWDQDPNRNRNIMDRQVTLSQQAADEAKAAGKKIDLMIWPESMFRTPLLTFQGENNPPPEASAQMAKSASYARGDLAMLARRYDTSLLVGLERFDWQSGGVEDAKTDMYNCAALVNRDGELVATYDKVHRVPFGEYIPLAKNLPALYFLTPMEGGLHPGDGPIAMPITTHTGKTITIAPNICYETVIPHVIRRQLQELTDAGTPPDLLVNVTNDAWFWGSSELDMHLACDIFRCVENGKPMVIAANGGISAIIDCHGHVLHRSPKMAEHVIVADVPLLAKIGNRASYSEWPALLCAIACVVFAVAGLIFRLGQTSEKEPTDTAKA